MVLLIVFSHVKKTNIFTKMAIVPQHVAVLTPRDMKVLKNIVMLLATQAHICISTEAAMFNVTFLSVSAVKEVNFIVIILALCLLTFTGMVLARAVMPPLSSSKYKKNHIVSILALKTNISIGMDLVLTTVLFL